MVVIAATITIAKQGNRKRHKTQLRLFQHVEARQKIQDENHADTTRRVTFLLTVKHV